MFDTRKTGLRLAAFFLAIGWAVSARAGLIANGGFESGLAGWTVLDQVGSDGTFFVQSGILSPVNGIDVPAPPEGLRAAMTDAQGPGTHVLYQDFFIPFGIGSGTLVFDLFIGNLADRFAAPANLDFAATNRTGGLNLNQQARVDILKTSADPFSADPADILMNLYQTLPGDPLISGYTAISRDLTGFLGAHRGETVRLRFSETDNLFLFNLGVDRVRLDVVLPEPATILSAALALSLVGGASVWRRRHGS